MRTFLAINLSSTLDEKIEQLMTDLSDEFPAGTIRWSDPNNIHLTLKFLGQVEEQKIEAIAARCAEIAARSAGFDLEVGGFGAFPNVARPRVLWVGIREDSGELARLQLGLEQALEALDFEPDRKGFTPHITLGRLRKGTKPAAQKRIAEAAQRIRVPVLGAVGVDELVLYKSTLGPDGAVHEVLRRFELEAA